MTGEANGLTSGLVGLFGVLSIDDVWSKYPLGKFAMRFGVDALARPGEMEECSLSSRRRAGRRDSGDVASGVSDVLVVE